MTSRRAFITGSCALVAASCVPLQDDNIGRIAARLRIVEASANGTLGVCFLDPASGLSAGYGDYARFPLCSTFKLSLAALVLKLAQTGEQDSAEVLRWRASNIIAHSPFTTARTGQGASLLELAEAAQVTSDNTAANLLLARMGGPERLNQFWRSLGDEISRLDRIEPELNNGPPGEIRDTTTPQATARTLGHILYGDGLTAANRELLKAWMAATQTGANRVRAGLPAQWRAGDKTGTSLWPGMGSVYADIGFVEAPARPPLTFAVWFRAAQPHSAIEPAAEGVFVEVGRVLARFALGS